jgi:hypothetical protein
MDRIGALGGRLCVPQLQIEHPHLLRTVHSLCHSTAGFRLALFPTKFPSKSLYLGAPRPTKWRAEILLSSAIHPACPDQQGAQPRAVEDPQHLGTGDSARHGIEDSDLVGGILLSSLPLPTVGCQLPPRLPSFPASGAAPWDSSVLSSAVSCGLSAIDSAKFFRMRSSTISTVKSFRMRSCKNAPA